MKAFVQYLILYMAKNVGLILYDPLFYMMILYSIYVYKRQISQFQKALPLKDIVSIVLKDITIGVCIGFLMSSVLSYFNIIFYVDNKILILLPIAVCLILIRPRFGCFSYVVPVAFMIEGLSKVFNIPLYTLDYRMLISLVGFLHIIEGILVIGFGHQKAISVPVYENHTLKTYKVMRHIWIVPLFFTLSQQNITLPVYALLAYGDHAKVRSPHAQSVLTGLLILLYGLILFVLGKYIYAGYLQVGGIVLLMPVLHEMIFIVEIYCNKKQAIHKAEK